MCGKNEVGAERCVESEVGLPDCLRRIWIDKRLGRNLGHQEIGSQAEVDRFLVKNLLAQNRGNHQAFRFADRQLSALVDLTFRQDSHLHNSFPFQQTDVLNRFCCPGLDLTRPYAPCADIVGVGILDMGNEPI
jgi:hypothetical protein